MKQLKKGERCFFLFNVYRFVIYLTNRFLAAIYVDSGTSNVKCGELIALMVEERSHLAEAAALLKPDMSPNSSSSQGNVPETSSSSSGSSTSAKTPFAMPAASVRLAPLQVDLVQVKSTGPGGICNQLWEICPFQTEVAHLLFIGHSAIWMLLNVYCYRPLCSD